MACRLMSPMRRLFGLEFNKHGPQWDIDVKDRLEQDKDMLTGRDIYQGFFTRSSLLSDCVSDSLTFEDPMHWVTNIKLKCGEYNLPDNTVDHVSHEF